MTSRLAKQTLFSASLITVAVGILSRPFGYLREAVIADFFGTSAALETFVLAFTIPELVAAIVFAAVPTALIPALQGSETWPSGSAARLFWRGLGILTAVLAALSLAVYLLRSEILGWLAPTLDHDAHALGCRILGIVAAVILFRGLEAYFRGWLHKQKHFLGPALSPFILNAVLLASIILLHDSFNITALAVGWLIGTALLFVYNGLVVWRVVAPETSFGDSKSQSPFFKLIVSVAILEMISFAYPAVDRAIASRILGEGQIAALRYSFYLTQLPPGLLVVTFSLASFPWITDLSVPSARDRLLALYRQSTGLIVFAMLPIVCGMVIFAPEIVTVAFQRGAFDAQSTQLTTGSFVAYSAGLLFYSVFIYQMRYYYARKLMLRLGIILAAMLVIKVVSSLLLVGPLAHRGLAFSTSIAWISGLVIMTVDLGRSTGMTMARGSGLKLARLLLAAAITVGFWLGLRHFWPIVSSSTMTIVVQLGVHALVGALIYLGLSYRLGLEEPRLALVAVRNRLKPSRPK